MKSAGVEVVLARRRRSVHTVVNMRGLLHMSVPTVPIIHTIAQDSVNSGIEKRRLVRCAIKSAVFIICYLLVKWFLLLRNLGSKLESCAD